MLRSSCLLGVSVLALLSGPSSRARTPPPEPPAEVLGQLDFWLGDWTVAWTDAEGNRHQGTNRIERILDGKVIRESFDASAASGFRGGSYSVFDRQSGQWKQTWVDNSGNYMDFLGHSNGDTFIFQRRFIRHDGVEMENRMVFKDITADSLTWDWEGRPAGADEWKLLWRLEYTRRK